MLLKGKAIVLPKEVKIDLQSLRNMTKDRNNLYRGLKAIQECLQKHRFIPMGVRRELLSIADRAITETNRIQEGGL